MVRGGSVEFCEKNLGLQQTSGNEKKAEVRAIKNQWNIQLRNLVAGGGIEPPTLGL